MKPIAAVLLVVGLAAAAAGGEAQSAAPASGRSAPLSASERALLKSVERAEKSGGDLTSFGDLFGSKDFSSIYEHPQAHQDAAQSLLARPDVSDIRKTILVLSLQKLPKARYLVFLDRLLALRKEARINEQVFLNGAFPTYDWNSVLAENYKDPKVIEFLKRARTAISDDDHRALIDDILSGRAADEAREDREMRASKPQ